MKKFTLLSVLLLVLSFHAVVFANQEDEPVVIGTTVCEGNCWFGAVTDFQFFGRGFMNDTLLLNLSDERLDENQLREEFNKTHPLLVLIDNDRTEDVAGNFFNALHQMPSSWRIDIDIISDDTAQIVYTAQFRWSTAWSSRTGLVLFLQDTEGVYVIIHSDVEEVHPDAVYEVLPETVSALVLSLQAEETS